MKFIFKIFILSICLPSGMQAHAVRVLLSEDLSDGWIISAPRGVILRDKKTDKTFEMGATFYNVKIYRNHDTISINNKKSPSRSFWIEPVGGLLSFEGNTYDGSFLVMRQKNKWLLINVLDLEEYIYSVLKKESWPTWPLEAHKVVAITCRTYLLHQLLGALQKDAPFHIKSTNKHQVYQGIHKNDLMRQAIEETRGVFMSYEQYPILAMFDCCCGGIIPGKTEGVVDFEKAPYLARSYPCTYCKDLKVFEWTAQCKIEQLSMALKESSKGVMRSIREVKITQRDEGGLVQKVSIKTKEGRFLVKSRDIFRCVKGVKSYCFTLFKSGDTVTFEGRGHGHHMGLCQWGAREMVRLGLESEEILQFYFPGVTFMKLKLKEKKPEEIKA